MSSILEQARAAGLTVLLNARIGREEYHSVSGSVAALQRFADAYTNEPIVLGGIAERLLIRAALQIDDADAHLMRAAARAIAQLYYTNLAQEAAAIASTTESSSAAR
ncbi:hypothetical protein [Paraburkholderia aromaticivorans]|uniref:hypothetical protein n=1 Tax=Paraburkholderia aromaticivorans TaxID=2026199 RepID=UPI0014561D0F|nr:hypothetical protein [Paraburkholderia aromaticivorans]